MKKGFKPHRHGAKVQEEHGDLFDGVPNAVLNNLVGGFGDDISDCFETHRHLVTKQSLKHRCHKFPDELGELLDGIESLI